MKSKIVIASIMCVVTSFFATGCASEGTRAKYDKFDCGTEAHGVKDAADAQAARGASSDGIIRASHFTGTKLNSLGMSKLYAMTQDAEAGVLSVYADLDPKDSKSADRKLAIAGFLKSRGLLDEQFTITDGTNTVLRHYAAEDIGGIKKTETGEAGSAATDPTAGGQATAK